MLLLLIDKLQNMKKVLMSLVTIVALLLFPVTSAKAATVSPNSGDYPPDSEITIAVTASPPVNNATSILVRLEIDGATIVPGSTSVPMSDESGYLSIGSCDTGVDRTTHLCIDFASVGDKFVQNGDYLFAFKIKFNTGSSIATIRTDEGSGYLVGSEVVPHEGYVLGTYTASANATIAPTDLPITGIEDYPGVVLALGLVTVAMGIGFFIWRNKAQNTAI